MKISDELKAAIKALPEKEKDKLLLRLIPKNNLLVHQLEYKLLENSETMILRRVELKDTITEKLSIYPEKFYSPGYLLMMMREISGMINLHVAITKDKLGEIGLNLYLLTEILNKNKEVLDAANSYSKVTFDDYVVKRCLKLMKLVATIDEDYHIDFKDDFHWLGKLIGNQHTTMKTAIYSGLDVNHLLKF
ncbi:MAG: hypothetical protein M3512_05600 [Bacteroidota bacterium]|nr:hypothetical protein [Bacteroidota bacterium]